MGYIPQQALQNLKKYSYKGVDKSLLSRYVLNPFWTWFVTFWPLSVAPNTITLSGLLIVFVNFLTMLYYDPTYLTEKGGASGSPQWIYFTWAAGLFAYQSFDAIDGKQARRTGMAGPLGEMFDHGCDAINTTLECILAAQALNLGRSWWTVASQIATLANFYLTTWEEYHTGQLFLGAFSGPVEGILMIVTIFVITGIYGPSIWDTGILTISRLDRIPEIADLIPNIGLNVSFMVFGGFGLAYNIFSSYMNVRQARLSTRKSTLQPLLYLLPFLLSASIQVFWLAHTHTHHQPLSAQSNYTNTTNTADQKRQLHTIHSVHSAIIDSAVFVPFLCAWGLQFAHQVGRMILAHVTSMPFPWWDWMWVWSAVGALDANAQMVFGRPPLIQTSAFNTALFVYLTFGISLFAYGRFCTLVINDITNYMGIACFTVRKKDSRGVWRDTTADAVQEKTK